MRFLVQAGFGANSSKMFWIAAARSLVSSSCGRQRFFISNRQIVEATSWMGIFIGPLAVLVQRAQSRNDATINFLAGGLVVLGRFVDFSFKAFPPATAIQEVNSKCRNTRQMEDQRDEVRFGPDQLIKELDGKRPGCPCCNHQKEIQAYFRGIHRCVRGSRRMQRAAPQV